MQSAVDSSFWAELTTLKLHRLKLSEEAVDIRGACQPGSGSALKNLLFAYHLLVGASVLSK